MILLRVEPLLRNDHEMGAYTRPVSGQRLGKNVAATMDKHAIEETGCFCVVRAEML
jgi:hypothetical protein